MRTGWLIAFTLGLVLTGAASASIIEDNTPLTYQNDGESGEDAPDEGCEPDEPSIDLFSGGLGQLLVVDDEVDRWSITFDRGDVGKEIEVELRPNPERKLLPNELIFFELEFKVFRPGCDEVEVRGDTFLCDPVRDVFTVTEVGTYTVEVKMDRSDFHSPLLDGIAGGGADNHCSPFCLSDYGIFMRQARFS